MNTHSKHSEDHAAPNAPESEKTAKPPKKRGFWGIVGAIVWGLVLLSLVLAAIAGGVAGGYMYTLYQELPSISRLEEFSPSLVTKVYDRDNNVIGEFFSKNARWSATPTCPKNLLRRWCRWKINAFSGISAWT
jgi:membrane peptidoglycan carboxypeptidase